MIGEEYAKRLSFHISKKSILKEIQAKVVMAVRPNAGIEIVGLQNGLFMYSLWSGYRQRISKEV